jgi:hypothetical protein
MSKREGNWIEHQWQTLPKSDRANAIEIKSESNGGHANKKERTIQARERIPSKQKNEKQGSRRVPFTSNQQRVKSAQTPHQLGQCGHLDRELLRKNRKELKQNARSSTTCIQIIESSGSKKKHAALQGCVRLSGVSSVPVQPTSEVLVFSCFSLFFVFRYRKVLPRCSAFIIC